MGDTSSNGGFPIAMLVYQRVDSIDYETSQVHPHV